MNIELEFCETEFAIYIGSVYVVQILSLGFTGHVMVDGAQRGKTEHFKMLTSLDQVNIHSKRCADVWCCVASSHSDP